MLFSLLFIKYLHYTKYPIDVQHFYSNRYITFTCCTQPRPGVRRSLSEQTSKHPVNKGFQSLPHSYIMRTSRCGPGRPGKLLSEQTSKQLSTGYSQFMAKLSTALPHELSSVAQEPWSPVHIGSVFSPWTTNDSTWDA